MPKAKRSNRRVAQPLPCPIAAIAPQIQGILREHDRIDGMEGNIPFNSS